MNLNDRRQQCETARFVADMATARYRVWRATVEGFKVNTGGRPLLEHIPEGVWVGRYASNDDAYSAVVEELQRIED